MKQRRRNDLARMKAKALAIGKLQGDRPMLKDAEHLAVCSCWMCGNPRRWSKQRLTLQELKAQETYNG
jgi:hypothetical protein